MTLGAIIRATLFAAEKSAISAYLSKIPVSSGYGTDGLLMLLL
ncbi:hypothetical protein [Glaciimonas immobilis]|uniref:Uncharacterized BrkB/YihY/UPF0761 family membrane protein n=1 Tax=Glaciimonas immobilis TaxID=728004 RepID=A0A840RWQ1_9BURK|nr:hypothetical protein [Glaciimonas immobilis]MBB5201296.1 uncharacterized BrkB/YihY/UPF0761 family membrane protein [Glaciimonas immobilis]